MSTDWNHFKRKQFSSYQGSQSILNQISMLNSEIEKGQQAFSSLDPHDHGNVSQEELESIRRELRETRDEVTALKQFQSFVTAASNDAVITTDRNLNITGWNKAAEDLLGWQAQELTADNIPHDIRARILQVLSEEEVINSLAEKNSWSGKTASFTKDHRCLKTLSSVGILWDNSGNFNGVIIVHHPDGLDKSPDFLERKVREHTDELIKANRVLQQELVIHKKAALLAKESEGKNRDLVDNIKLGIFRCTPGRNGRFIEINRAMEDITGYSREELLQKEVCSLYLELSEDCVFTNEVNVTDWKETRELILKKKDGSEITVAVNIVAIRFDSGSIQYLDGILEDISERKQAQQQIQDSLQRLQRTINEIIEAMAYIGEVRDPYTAGHQRRVAQLSIEIAKMMEIEHDQFEGLTMAAYVHDIGKILVPADILSKPGKLTKPEFDMIKDHSRIGYEILKTIEFPWPIATIVLQHHERLDGTGYPAGVSGKEIIAEARILAVADVVEAMSSHRPYRPALSLDQALKEINDNRGKLYDPDVVDACTNLFTVKNFTLS